MLERFWHKVIRRKGVTWLILPGIVLWLVSLVYRLLFLLRRRLGPKPHKVSVPVISVGNISVGGSGKTPMVGFIAGTLLDEGIRVGIVSSAYGRGEEVSFIEEGYAVQNRPVRQTGDEVMLLALQVPGAIFSVDPVKTNAALALAESGLVDVIIVDDGFQHFGLARDINLVTYDAAVKKRVLKLFPNGILREPVSSLRRADIVVITRVKFAEDIQRLEKRLQRKSPHADFYTARFNATRLIRRDRELPLKYIEDKSVFLFAGVGNFRALRKQVDALAGDLDCAMEMADHQDYDQATLNRIKAEADEYDSDLIVTTSKDWVKLGDFDFDREICYLDLVIDLDPGEEKLTRHILERLNLTRRDQ